MAAAPAFASEKYSGKILKLSDGDTFQFQPVNTTEKFKVRMIGNDTAETHFGVPGVGEVNQGYWGEQGELELAKHLKVNDKVTLEVFGEDKYGRKLARVFKNGVDINLKMIESGWSALYLICEPDTECRTGDLPETDYQKYRAACRKAVTQGKGLFSKSRPVPQLPFVFRAQSSNKPLERFVGDISKDLYYPPKEYKRVHICDRLFYPTENDAADNGFDPAH